MIQLMALSTTALMSFLFLQMSHPLATGLSLLIQTTLICLITGMVAKTFWFSYILFLIFLGGMLVLFIYVTSLASNEMFSMSTKTVTLTLLMMTGFIMIMWILDKIPLSLSIMNNEMTPLTQMNSYTQENTLPLAKMYNPPTNIITLIMVNYLLITMIAVVKITDIFQGPLRPMN